jgi:hypothetical protein
MKKIYLQAYIITIGLIVLLISSVFLYDVVSKPGNYFKIGRSNGSKVYLRATPEYEYQLIIEDDKLIIESFGRFVDSIHLDSAGKLAQVLIKDNE